MNNSNNFFINKIESSSELSLVAVVIGNCTNKQSDNIEVLMTRDITENEFSIIHCSNGNGYICLNDRTVEIYKDSIFLIKTNEINTVIPKSSEWTFVQYRFVCSIDFRHINYGVVQSLPYKKDEDLFVKDLFYQFYTNSITHKRISSAEMLAKIYHWESEINTISEEKNINMQSIQFAIEYIRNHINESITISKISAKFGMSERHFRYLFQEITGKSPKSYQQELKLSKCASLLVNSNLTIHQIAEDLGYYSQYQLSRDFKKFFGKSPSEYRKNI